MELYHSGLVPWIEFLQKTLSLLWTFTLYFMLAFLVLCITFALLKVLVFDRRGFEINLEKKVNGRSTGFLETKWLEGHPFLVTFLEYLSVILMLHFLGYFLLWLAYLAQ